MCLFLRVPYVGLWSVVCIVVFPCHTYLLSHLNWSVICDGDVIWPFFHAQLNGVVGI